MAIVIALAIKIDMAIMTILAIETNMAIVTILAIKTDIALSGIELSIKCKELVPGWIL